MCHIMWQHIWHIHDKYIIHICVVYELYIDHICVIGYIYFSYKCHICAGVHFFTGHSVHKTLNAVTINKDYKIT